MKTVLLAVTALLFAVAPAVAAQAAQHPSPSERLLSYVWAYGHGVMRPYVMMVTITGGHHVIVNGRAQLESATANVRETFHDSPVLTVTARHICATVAAGVQALHLRTTIAAVEVRSVEGDPVARC